jgi:hypothetical protein
MNMELLAIVNEVIAICNASPQYVDWAGYRDQGELLEDLQDHARRLGTGDTSRLRELHVLFLPSGPLQDIAIDSGWHDKYMTLASRFDELYRQCRS